MVNYLHLNKYVLYLILNLLWICVESKILILAFSYDTLRSQEKFETFGVRATRSRTFTLYDYIYKKRSLGARGALVRGPARHTLYNGRRGD